MLGYVPRCSAVLVALRPPRGRVAMTMRVDLPDRAHESALAQVLAGHAQRAGATSAVLVVYDDRPGDRGGEWRGASLARATRAALRQRGGLRLSDALSVRDGRWRSLLCRDRGCCPEAGTRLRDPGDPSAAGVALAAEGAAVLPDRESLAASVAAPTGQRARALLDLHEQTARQVSERLERGGDAAADVRAETLTLFAAAVERYFESGPPSDEEAVRLIVGIGDVPSRDAVLAWAADDDTDALMALLVDLAGRAVEPFDPAVLTAVAWVSYARGDGTLANIAVDRALASDPDYSMAQLVASGLEAAVHPALVRQVSREVRSELAGD
jgi:hypothetical protein